MNRYIKRIDRKLWNNKRKGMKSRIAELFEAVRKTSRRVSRK
jgi:hypothetical protein